MRLLRPKRLLTAAAIAGLALLPARSVGSSADLEPAATTDDEAFESPADVMAAELDQIRRATPPEPAEASESPAATAPSPDPTPSPEPPPPPTPQVFAHADGLALIDPAPAVVLRGFHESNASALTLEPAGTAVINDRGIDPPTPTDGPDYAILSSRGRSGAPTSAADIAVPADEPVRATVTGTVVEANPYQLYGRYRDVLVYIQPDDRKDLIVAMFHLRDPQVSVGDRVVAGETVIAGSSRQLPFRSQIDDHTPEAGPHVHIEVRYR